MAQSRFWCFTLNNYSAGEEEKVRELCISDVVQYAVFGREVADSGTPHLQGYIQFMARQRIGTVRRWIPRAHAEIARRPAEAAAYCKKDGDYSEFGDPELLPASRPRSGVRSLATSRRESLAESFRLGGPAAAEASDPALYAYVGHNLVRNVYRAPVSRPDINGIWYYGRPGTGKSKRAWEQYPDAYPKPATTKWWNGYRGEVSCIIDDLSPEGIGLQHLLVWTDRYPWYVETKGGMMPLEVITIVVTSNFTPEEVYPNAAKVSIEALKRRFTFTMFSEHIFN
jgi:Putative viral replication protein/RNA helicase